jgi:hypothetical protein
MYNVSFLAQNWLLWQLLLTIDFIILKIKIQLAQNTKCIMQVRGVLNNNTTARKHLF